MKTKITDLWFKADKTPKARKGRGNRWLARWEHEGHNGSKTFDTKSQADLWLAKQKVAHNDRGLILSGKGTLAAYIDRWLQSHPAQIATVDAYRRVIDNYIAPTIGHMPLSDVEDWHIERMYRDMAVRCPTQVLKAHTILNQMFRRAAKERLVHSSPMLTVERPRRQAGQVKSAVHVLTPEQVAALAGVLSPADRMIFRTAVETGLRPGELAGLSVEDVDLDGGILHVRRAMKQPYGLLGHTKTGWERSVPLSSNVAQIVSECADHAEPVKVEQDSTLGGGYTERAFLFPGPGEGHYEAPLPHHLWANGRFKAGLRKAGIDIPGHLLYITRHTYASSLIKAGVDVKRVSTLMGHASPTMTLSIYSHLFGTDWSDVTAHFDTIYG